MAGLVEAQDEHLKWGLLWDHSALSCQPRACRDGYFHCAGLSMFFTAVLHSFAVSGDRDLETPLDGNFHPIRRSRAFPHPFPARFHWDGTNVYEFIRPLSFLGLWECGNFFLTLSGENSPFSRRNAAPAALVGFSTLSPGPSGQDMPFSGWDEMASWRLLWFGLYPPPIHT